MTQPSQENYSNGLVCPDCIVEHCRLLTPDHKVKRSAGGGHERENIDWVCNEAPCFCHDKRDNRGDP